MPTPAIDVRGVSAPAVGRATLPFVAEVSTSADLALDCVAPASGLGVAYVSVPFSLDLASSAPTVSHELRARGVSAPAVGRIRLPLELFVRGAAAPAITVGRVKFPDVFFVRGAAAPAITVGRVRLPDVFFVRGASAPAITVGRIFIPPIGGQSVAAPVVLFLSAHRVLGPRPVGVEKWLRIEFSPLSLRIDL